MHAFIKIFFLIAFVFLSFNLQVLSMNIDENNRNHAITIANNIINRSLSPGVENIMNDHIKRSHQDTDSYFMTNDDEDVEVLIRLTAGAPDNFAFYTKRGNYRLSLSRIINQDDALYVIGKRYIGMNDDNQKKQSNVVICFAINDLNTVQDSINCGVFLTGFPARNNYVLDHN